MKDFSELTSRGRALRLRRMALEALKNYDLNVQLVRLLSNAFNAIFRVDTTSGEKWVLRVSLPGHRSLAEIRSEMMWLDALRRTTDLGVPKPLATRDGDMVATVKYPGVPEARHCIVFSWVPGRDLIHCLSPETMFKVGVLASQLHDHVTTFAPPDGFWLPTLDRVFPYGKPGAIFEEAYRHLFPPDRLTVFQRATERATEALDRLYANPIGLRVLHADIHQLNVKVHRGKLYLLDFDDAMWGYPVQDIAITFYHLQAAPDHLALREAFKQGYTSRREWPEQYPGQIEALVAWRALAIINFFIQSDDPYYRQTIPSALERTEARLRAFLDESF